MQWVSTDKKAVLLNLNLDLSIKLLRIFKPVGFCIWNIGVCIGWSAFNIVILKDRKPLGFLHVQGRW